jgi:hypothetical protein
LNPTVPARQFRLYLVQAAVAAALLFGCVAGLNGWVDPQDRFGNNTLGIYIDQDRPSKAKLVHTWPHDALLLGSSMVGFIDPQTLPGYRFFNGAFVAAAPEEILSFLRHLGGDVKFVAIGFDLYMFNLSHEPWIDIDRFAPGNQDATPWHHYIFSIDVAIEAIENIVRRLRGEPSVLTPSGQRNSWHIERADAAFPQPDHERTLNDLRNNHFGNFRYAEARVETLRQIKALLEERRQDYMIFINPMNRSVLHMLNEIPARADYARFRQDVAAVFPDVKDASTGAWSDDRFFFNHDAFHYRPATGTAFLGQFIREWLAEHPR